MNPLVNAPFWNCPKCKEPYFGVIGVGEFHYNRRCAKCGYPSWGEPSASFPLTVVKKKVIYLDQCILSGMVKSLHPDLEGKADPFYRQAFELLDRLSKLQLIVCPDSQFHEEESIFSGTPDEHKRVFELLSHGVSYDNMWMIFRREVHEQFRKWLDSEQMGQTDIPRERVVRGKIDSWQERLLVTVNSKRMEMAKPSLANTKASVFADMKPVLERWEKESGKKFDYWYEQELSHWPFSIIDGFKKYYADMVSAMAGRGSIESIINGPTPFYSTFKDLTDYLEKKFEGQEVRKQKLNEFLTAKCLEHVPFIRIYTSLMAAIATKISSGGMKKEKIEPSFFNDILMISTLLPFCDAIFLERQMAGYLRDKPLNQLLDKMPKVFSSANKEEFLEYLRDIEKNASKEHLEKIREVYGENWGQPFTSVLGEYKSTRARE